MDSLSRFLQSLTSTIDFFCRAYDKFIIMGDFNAQALDSAMKNFIKINVLLKSINLMKEINLIKGSPIDLILTSRKFSFKHSNSYKINMSDHHHLLYSMLKSNIPNSGPKLVNYRDYKNFSFKNFNTSLDNALRHCSTEYKHFEYIFTSVLN